MEIEFDWKAIEAFFQEHGFRPNPEECVVVQDGSYFEVHIESEVSDE